MAPTPAPGARAAVRRPGRASRVSRRHLVAVDGRCEGLGQEGGGQLRRPRQSVRAAIENGEGEAYGLRRQDSLGERHGERFGGLAASGGAEEGAG